jgi:hypothetical protein
LCIGVGLLRIEVVAALWAGLKRPAVACGYGLSMERSWWRRRVSSLWGLLIADLGMRSRGWRSTSLWILGRGGGFTWRLSYPRSSGGDVDGRVDWRLALSVGLVYGASSGVFGLGALKFI